jgi:hypothetical protein
VPDPVRVTPEASLLNSRLMLPFTVAVVVKPPLDVACALAVAAAKATTVTSAAMIAIRFMVFPLSLL